MSFFREYDIRALVGEELDEAAAKRVGQAVGTFTKGADFVVGYDVRESSKWVHDNFVEGLMSCGCKVTSIGNVPSPVLFYNCMLLKMDGGIITSSHNPYQYNGFKFVKQNGCSYVDEYKDLRKIYDSGDFISGEGSLKTIDGIKPYTDFILSKVKIEKKVKIVVECLHASGGLLVPKFYEEFGMDVIVSHQEPMPNFNNERPEPKGENLKEAGAMVVKENANFGVALDGDCDRSVLIDDKGREINGSVASAIFIKDILTRQKGNVVVTVDCNSELKQLSEELGGQLFWSEVGHGFIGKVVHENNALYGGEMSSHMWFELYPFSDGFLTGIKMAEILARTGRKMSELVDEIEFAPMHKEYVTCKSHEQKEVVITALIDKYKAEQENATLTRDGVKFFLNEIEWIMIRKSNNMPEVCLVIEAKTEDRIKELRESYKKVIDETISSSS
ncbi:MAG: hypothetical protein GY861_16115 [bacterium]|nr:hypothetical protein [bacterium]